MSPLTLVLYVIVIIVALLLTGLILIQQSKGGGFGSAFGGVGEAVFGAKAGSHLSKLTVILTTVFFVLTLALVVITGKAQNSNAINLVPEDKPQAVTEAAAAPVAPAKESAGETVDK